MTFVWKVLVFGQNRFSKKKVTSMELACVTNFTNLEFTNSYPFSIVCVCVRPFLVFSYLVVFEMCKFLFGWEMANGHTENFSYEFAI